LASSLSGTGSETDPQQGLNASDQQHSGTVHQDMPGGVGRTNRWRPRDLGIDNSQRVSMALGALSPHQSRHWLRIAA